MKTNYFEFSDYTQWDHEIFEAATQFELEGGIWPNILLANGKTLEAIDLFMSKKLFAEGLVAKVQSISVFASEKGDIEICLDEELPLHSFKLIYDEEAEFVDQEGHDEMVGLRGLVVP
jgi:hypothetical protein